MGFDRPGITPAAKPRKKVARKAGGVAGVVAAATPKPSKTVRRRPARPRVEGTARAGVGASATTVNAAPTSWDKMSPAEQRRMVAHAKARGARLYDIAEHKRQATARRASIAAPVLSLLDQTTRPLHGIAGGVDAAITGRNVPRAVGRGLANKDKVTFSKVLKDVGAPKAVQATAGFGLDVAADPTTYLSFGTAPLVRKGLTSAVEKGAETGLKKAAPKVAAKGLTVKVAGKELPGVRTATGRTVGRAAAATGRTKVAKAVKRVAADVNPNIAPEGVGKADWQAGTAAARRARATTATARRAAEAKAVALRKGMGKDDMAVTHAIETKTIGSLPTHLQPAARELDRLYRQMDATEKAAGIKGGSIGELTPKAIPARVAPARVDAAEVAHARAVLERRRVETATNPATRTTREAAAVSRARAAARKTGAEVSAARNADVAERVAIKQATAHNARIAGAPKAYVPHKTVESIAGKPPKALRGSVGKRTIAPGARKARKVDGTLAAKVAAEPGKYSEDAALVYANRAAESGKAVAQADLNRRLAALGRPYKAGETVPDPKLEGVFRLDGSDLPEVTGAALKRLHRDGPAPGERVVILHRDLVKHAHAQSGGAVAGTTSGRVYDRIQGGFKQVATLTPGFHVRNLIGDTQNAYLAQSGLRLPGNMARSGRVLRAVKREEEAQRTLGATARPVKGVLGGRGGVKIGTKVVLTRAGGRKRVPIVMTYEELAHEATRVGAIRQGYTGRDITDQLATRAARGSAIKKVSGDTRRGHAARAVKRTLQSREDLPRLATYISARRAGMSPEAAAAYEMKYHFDYANLTEFERKVARRALPFYTFSSRNIPLQMKAVLTNPGKYANYEKLREEAAIAVGLQPGWEGDLTPWEQRNAPIPVRIKGHLYTVSMGLPLTDLDEFPTTADALKLATEQASKLGSLVTPLLKDPVEIYANRSLFFRDDIKRSTAPLVPAPTWTKDLPDSWKRKLGVVDDLIDKRTGKKIMGWDAWSNYAAHVVPGLPALGVKLSGPTDRTGHDRAQTAIGATGVKVTPVNPAAVKVNDLYDELARIQTQLGALSQRGIKAGAAQRDALNARARVIEQQIYGASTAVIKPTQGRPRRARQAAPSYGGTGGLGSGGSGGTGGLSSGGLGSP